ncbi:protein phosphatase 2C-related protein [Dictyostelium discoideum AX4]|uniref:Protein phosphatase 2C-related protein n=1 Tax=Dictyostelium discoideum TaxID=44689 RepID=Q54PX6_DICDI|nr:protein phosphatase 2C-related protein [Dictyostelium discoideum AX4]EAL65310.1 protein phosphatase 2C-related protein [Dictyostelium discoideum AX4]|eukprot:XP_638669.1 protein phosphatase 2C-related protein [Dictyostelium discoideum AX4]
MSTTNTDMIDSSSDIKDETITHNNDTVDTTKATEITADKNLEVSIDKNKENKNTADDNKEKEKEKENINNNNNNDTTNNNNSNNNNNNTPPKESNNTTTTTKSEESSSDDTYNSGTGDAPSTPQVAHQTIQPQQAQSTHFTTEPSSKTRSVRDFGVSFEKNARYRRTMEDEHVIIDCFGGDANQGYFAIYDGHGGRGAVEFTAKTLHVNLLDEINKSPEGDILELFRNSYLLTDKQMNESEIQFSGTTSITALIRKNPVDGEKYLYVANAGDARAVVCHNKVAERLSYDHKGSDPEEVKRIDAAGGFVCNGRVNGILAVTRSLGDHSMKDHVIGDPYKRSIKLDSGHTHLILACDGLWDVTSDQDAVDLILNETEAQKMSDKLLLHALKKGSTDNISIIVVIL